MTGFNLSALAVRERAVTLFLILAVAIAGIYAFLKLGRAEDPSFTVKVLTVTAAWPGATAQEMQDLVAEPLEKRLQELRWYDRVETMTRPGLVGRDRDGADGGHGSTAWRGLRGLPPPIPPNAPRSRVSRVVGCFVQGVGARNTPRHEIPDSRGTGNPSLGAGDRCGRLADCETNLRTTRRDRTIGHPGGRRQGQGTAGRGRERDRVRCRRARLSRHRNTSSTPRISGVLRRREGTTGTPRRVAFRS